MTHADNRIIARWTLLVCLLACTFFTGYLVAPSPARSTHQVEKACEANTAPSISWMLGNLIACLRAGGVKVNFPPK